MAPEREGRRATAPALTAAGEIGLRQFQAPTARYTMTYDADGLRRSFLGGATTINYVWDGQDVLLEKAVNGVTQTAYTQTPALFGQNVAQRAAGASRFYHSDALGTVTELTDATGAEVTSLRYRTWVWGPAITGRPALRHHWTGKDAPHVSCELS